MAWCSPFSLPGSWYKGNLHTHTTQSDGERTVDEALVWYASRGYDFCAITDHWVHSAGRLVEPGFLQISGAELHGQGYHMLALGLSALPDRELEDDPALLASSVRALGGIPLFAHPYWTGQTSASLLSAPDIAGIEVFNSVCDAAYGLGHSRAQWDEALATGRCLIGLATDDVHWRYGAQGRGFVMVRALELSESAVLGAIARGAFYASMGPRIVDLRVTHTSDGQAALAVACSPCQHITFYAKDYLGHRYHGLDGRPIDAAVYPIKDEQVYLRVECCDAQGRVAWSNPVFVADLKA